MNFESIPPQEQMSQQELKPLEKEDKKAKYQKMLKMASEFNDPENKEKDEKDPKIVDTVAALWTLEVATSQSCEGHIDHGRPYPWIMIEGPNEPKQRFNNEYELKAEIAERNNVPVEQIDWNSGGQPAKEFWYKVSEDDETQEYKKWREENKKLYDKVKGWLDDFYKTREVSGDVKLTLDGSGDSAFEIRGGKEELDDQKRDLKELISKRQEEMAAFTQFLKEKINS